MNFSYIWCVPICCSYISYWCSNSHLWPGKTSLNWIPRNLAGTVPLICTASFINRDTRPVARSPFLHATRSAPRCEGYSPGPRGPRAAEMRAGTATGIRTLRSLTVPCSPPRSLQCLSCLVSVNWLKQRRTCCIRNQRHFIQLSRSEPLPMCNFRTLLLHKARHVYTQKRIYCQALQYEALTPRAAWNSPGKCGEGGAAFSPAP